MIISVMGAKGGCGKSVLALMLCNYLRHKKKHSVMLVDADQQKYLYDLRDDEELADLDLSGSYKVEHYVNHSPSRWADYLDRHESKHDYIVIDMPGNFGSGELGYIAQRSGVVIVPVIAEQGAFSILGNFIRDLNVIVDRKKTNVLAVQQMARRVKESAEIKGIEEWGAKLVGSLPLRAKYSRFRSTRSAISDPEHDKLMRSIYKHIKL